MTVLDIKDPTHPIVIAGFEIPLHGSAFDLKVGGGYAFPFCHIAVLSNINRSQIEHEAQELTLLFASGTTITRDELATWDALEPKALAPRGSRRLQAGADRDRARHDHGRRRRTAV